MQKLITIHFQNNPHHTPYDFSDIPELNKYLEAGFYIKDFQVHTNSGDVRGSFLIVVHLTLDPTRQKPDWVYK